MTLVQPFLRVDTKYHFWIRRRYRSESNHCPDTFHQSKWHLLALKRLNNYAIQLFWIKNQVIDITNVNDNILICFGTWYKRITGFLHPMVSRKIKHFQFCICQAAQSQGKSFVIRNCCAYVIIYWIDYEFSFEVWIKISICWQGIMIRITVTDLQTSTLASVPTEWKAKKNYWLVFYNECSARSRIEIKFKVPQTRNSTLGNDRNLKILYTCKLRFHFVQYHRGPYF